MLDQIILLRPRNAKPLDPSKQHLHQARNPNIHLPHFPKEDHQYRTLRQAAGVVIRDKEATYQLKGQTTMGGRPAVTVTPRVALVAKA